MICAKQLRECCLSWPLAKIIIIIMVLGHVPKPKDNQFCATVRLLRAWWGSVCCDSGGQSLTWVTVPSFPYTVSTDIGRWQNLRAILTVHSLLSHLHLCCVLFLPVHKMTLVHKLCKLLLFSRMLLCRFGQHFRWHSRGNNNGGARAHLHCK